METFHLTHKKVLFHGIWKAGLRVSENLIKSIGADVVSKPSKPCALHLSSAGLTLELLTTADGKPRKTDQVPFDSIRDIFINQYQPRCLTIVYLDPSNKFSLMACSSNNQKDLEDICKAYRDHKNVNLRNININKPPQQVSTNWTLQHKRIPSDRQSVYIREGYFKSPVSNGFVPGSTTNGPNGSGEMIGSSQRSDTSHMIGSSQRNDTSHMIGSSQRSDTSHMIGSSQRNDTSPSYKHVSGTDDINSEDVFGDGRIVVVHEPEDVTRESTEGTMPGRPVAFSCGTQTGMYEEDFDIDSITSGLSQLSSTKDFHYISDDVSFREKSSEISADEYYALKDTHGNRTVIKSNGDQHFGDFVVGVEENSRGMVMTNGSHQGIIPNHDFRSVGAQTEAGAKVFRRYAKKQVNRVTSNSYKEKAAAVKQKHVAGGPQSPGAETIVDPDVSASRARSTVSSGSQHKSIAGQSSNAAHSVKRTMSIGSTTVVKSIESVYLSRSTRRSNSARSHRHIIIYTPTAPGRVP